MSGSHALIRDALAETKLAFAAVLAEPVRILRFMGPPGIVAAIVFLWGLWVHPYPVLPEGTDESVIQEAERAWNLAIAPYVLVALPLAIWAYMRLQVRWFRWTIDGDEGGGFLALGFGSRELAMLGWSFLVGLFLIPAFLAMAVMASVLAVVGSTAFGLANGEAGLEFGGLLGALLGQMAGLFLVYWMSARLVPGLVPLALGRPGALSVSWKATRNKAGAATLVLWLAALPSNLIGLFLELWLPGSVIGMAVAIVIGLVGTAASAIAMARFWRAVVAPVMPPVPVTSTGGGDGRQ